MNRIFLSLVLSVICLCFRVQSQTSTPLLINEVCSSNIDQWVDPSFNYGGWIELYNPTSSTINISNWHFSDEDNNLQKACLFGTVTIPANGYATVWFDHYDSKYAAKMVDMKLDCDGGTLFISDNIGNLVLSLDYPKAMSRCSWARLTDGGEMWSYCAKPTPGEANNGPYCDMQLEAPIVSRESHISSNAESIHVTIPEGCILRYTTDGTTPTEESESCTSGIFSPTTTTHYRYRLFADGYLPSPVAAHTYIQNTLPIDLPILSIYGSNNDFFSDEMGIFTKGTNGRPGRGDTTDCNWNMDWERSAFFEYFSSAGDLLFSQEVGIERCGGWSRVWEPWSFKIKANKQYGGYSWLPYTFFDEKPYIKNKTLQIRNGGNDHNGRLFDAALQQIIARSGLDVDYQAYQPVAHFVNGIYKGVINVREPNNKHLVYANYGIDNENLDQFEMRDTGYYQSCGTKAAFSQLIALSKQCSNEDSYQQICEMLDIDSYCNYMAVEFYLGNWDWPVNNVKGYRPRFENGKFRFILFDLDGAFDLGSKVFSTFKSKQFHTYENIYDSPVSRYPNVEIEFVTLFLNMLNNEKFRKHFIDTYCLIAGSVFNPIRCNSIISELANRVTFTQALGSFATTPWATANNLIAQLSTSRQTTMISALKNFSPMKLSGKTAQKFTITTDIADARLLLNGMPIPTNRFEGSLFTPATVNVLSPAGYAFSGWKKFISTSKTIIQTNSIWKYYDKGSLNDTTWYSNSYDDSLWDSGYAPLGYHVGGELDFSTIIGYGPNMNDKYPTYYFRTTFNLDETPSKNDEYFLTFTVDDGCVIYVNGVEAIRHNMPSGPIGFATFASIYSVNSPDTGSMRIATSLLHAGQNTIAVEVHNNNATSSDIYWSAYLTQTTESSGALICETSEYTLPSSGSQKLIACFEPIAPDASNPLPPVVINEVSAANSIYVCDYHKKHDWLELYNTTSEPIDLTGMYLTDKVGKPQKWQISAEGSEASTVIPAHGYKLIWCDKLASDRELHAPFLLGNEDNSQVMLSAEDGSWKSVLTYSAHEGTCSVGRYPDGADQVYLMTRTTPGSTNQVTTISPVVEQPSTIHTLPADAAPDTWALYDLGGRLLDQGEGTIHTSLPAGIYLVREGNLVRKVMIK